MSGSFAILPYELIEKIFMYNDTAHNMTCSMLNKELRSIAINAELRNKRELFFGQKLQYNKLRDEIIDKITKNIGHKPEYQIFLNLFEKDLFLQENIIINKFIDCHMLNISELVHYKFIPKSELDHDCIYIIHIQGTNVCSVAHIFFKTVKGYYLLSRASPLTNKEYVLSRKQYIPLRKLRNCFGKGVFFGTLVTFNIKNTKAIVIDPQNNEGMFKKKDFDRIVIYDPIITLYGSKGKNISYFSCLTWEVYQVLNRMNLCADYFAFRKKISIYFYGLPSSMFCDTKN